MSDEKLSSDTPLFPSDAFRGTLVHLAQGFGNIQSIVNSDALSAFAAMGQLGSFIDTTTVAQLARGTEDLRTILDGNGASAFAAMGEHGIGSFIDSTTIAQLGNQFRGMEYISDDVATFAQGSADLRHMIDDSLGSFITLNDQRLATVATEFAQNSANLRAFVDNSPLSELAGLIATQAATNTFLSNLPTMDAIGNIQANVNSLYEATVFRDYHDVRAGLTLVEESYSRLEREVQAPTNSTTKRLTTLDMVQLKALIEKSILELYGMRIEQLEARVDRLDAINAPNPNITTIQDYEQEIARFQALLAIHRNTLFEYEKKKAKYSIDVPVFIILEIEEIQQKINALTNKIKSLKYDLDQLIKGQSNHI